MSQLAAWMWWVCRRFFEYIGHLRELGKAVVICTHRLDEAERLCDRFGLLHRGNLAHEGTLQQLQGATSKDHLVDMFAGLLSGGSLSGGAHV